MLEPMNYYIVKVFLFYPIGFYTLSVKLDGGQNGNFRTSSDHPCHLEFKKRF